MKKSERLTLAFFATTAATLALLAGCAPTGQGGRTDTGTSTYDRGADVSVVTVNIPDGRSVYCIDSGRGLSCDWEGAN